MMLDNQDKILLTNHVKNALKEDAIDKDVTTKSLSLNKIVTAQIISKQTGVLCGTYWVNEVFRQIDKRVKIKWNKKDSSLIQNNQTIASITGNSSSILTGERVALNFLQTLSGISNKILKYKKKLNTRKVKILHTRKTLPGWRYATIYAAKIMGCNPHRTDLSESILIKENHLCLNNNLTAIVRNAKKMKKSIIVEIKNISELKNINGLDIDRILLDNFKPSDIKKIVKRINNIPIEVSGNINIKNINKYNIPGVSFISIGDLTKNITTHDFSLLML